MSKRKNSPRYLFLIVAVALAFSTVQIQGATAAHKSALDAALATYSAALAKADATYNAALATADATLDGAAALEVADAAYAKARVALAVYETAYNVAKAAAAAAYTGAYYAKVAGLANADDAIATYFALEAVWTATHDAYTAAIVEHMKVRAAGGFDAVGVKAAYNAAAAATAAAARAKAYAAALATADAAIAAYGAAIDTKFATRIPPVLKPKPVSLKSVSNGCGGGEAHTDPQIADTFTFSPVSGDKWIVNFRLACNVHDAGYSGVLVRDPLQGNKEIDFSTWSRKKLDKLFLTNLKQICWDQLPGYSPLLLTKCYALVHTYYALVRLVGELFFEANPITPGTDTHKRRSKL